MKKLFAAIVSVLAIGSIALVSCEKNSTEAPTPTPPTPTGCQTFAYLFADSINCSGASTFYIPATGKTVVSATPIVAIDTIVNGASFKINYDSIGTEPCSGALRIKGNITCYQRQ